MKKVLFFFAAFAFVYALTGCKDKTRCVTRDFKIVNQIESYIVVELKFGDRQEITIKPGDTQLIHTEVRCYEPGIAYSMVPELVNAEMRIDGAVISRQIWWSEHWNLDREEDNSNYGTYTLIVTDGLLETIRK